MKLAEALILRADHQKRIEQLRQRLLRNAKVQEGDEPAENPGDLRSEFERVSNELQRLIQRINRTNARSSLDEQATISDALAHRDVLALRHALYRDLAQAATVTQERHTRSEVKFRSTVNIADIQKRADELAQQYRELDMRIQEGNWRIDLVE